MPKCPNDSVGLLCAPTPVARGSTVECRLSLPKWHTLKSTGFLSRVFIEDETGQFDTLDVVTLAFSDGTSTSAGNIDTWKTSGPAVGTSAFTIYYAAEDSSGNIYSDSAFTTFSVSYQTAALYTSQATSTLASVQLPDTASSYGNQYGLVAGLTGYPMFINGSISSATDAFVSQQSGSYFTPIGNLSVTSAASGPNKGFKFVSSTLQLTPVPTALSSALNGTGPWVADQDGDDENGMTINFDLFGSVRPYCDKNVNPWVIDSLSSVTKRHEGVVAGAPSHHKIYNDALTTGAFALKLQRFGRFRFRDTVSTDIMVTISEAFAFGLVRPVSADHQLLDDPIAATGHLPWDLVQAVSCIFDNLQ